MRNNTSPRKTIGSAKRKQNNGNNNIMKGFFVSLALVALCLAMLAVHLTSRLESSKTTTQPSDYDAPPVIERKNDGSAVMEPESAASIARSAEEVVVAHNAKSVTITITDNNANAEAEEEAVIMDNNAKLAPATPNAPPYPAGPKTDVKYARDRVYCMVPFVWNEASYRVIMRTWGKRCDVINFLTDSVVVAPGGKLEGDKIITHDDPMEGYKHYSEFPEGTFPENVHFINMTRPWTGCKDDKTGKPKVCRHIWEKMWRSWIYVGDNHLNQAEWFCKVDYDTYFFPENLQYYVRDYKRWNPYAEHHYFGHALSHKRPRPDMAAGAAACWSHKTMKGIAEVYRNMPKGHTGSDRGRCEDRPLASEEISTSMCLMKGLNVSVEAMRDDELREYVMVDPYHNHLGWNRTEQGEWWFWKNKPENVGQLEECCSIRPMGIHKYKQTHQIEQLDDQFYGPSNNKELTRLKGKTRRYADKVRRAMGFDQ